MISILQFFAKPHTQAQTDAVVELLKRVNALGQQAADADAFDWPIDPDTDSSISGVHGGDGDGGMRTPGSKTGAPDSAHRVLPADAPKGAAVDVFDPNDHLDTWLDQFEDGAGGNSKLEELGLYREHPDATAGWCHLTTRAPRSGRRTFQP